MRGGDSPWTTCFFPFSGVQYLTSQRQLTSGRLAFSFFQGVAPDLATATHLWMTCFFLLPGCIPLSHNGDSPRSDLLFLHFRGAFPYLATATHLGATCFSLLPGCIPLSRNGDSPRSDLLFPSSGVHSLILQWRLTSERLAFPTFRGALPGLATATAASFVDVSLQLYCRRLPAAEV